MTTLRELRTSKLLSQVAVAEALGVTESAYQRIEAGTGKTTEAEVEKATKVVNKMKAGTRKLAGRPFKDPAKRAAAEAARAAAEDLIGATPTPIAKGRSSRAARAKK